MKRFGNRSFDQYVSWHVACGFKWSEHLRQEASQGQRNVTRGQGLARQSAPLQVDQVRCASNRSRDGKATS